MTLKRKSLIVIGSLAFSFGVLSIGYGFWTDKLDIEGKADVKFSVNVTDDIIEVEETTPEAVEIVVNPELDSSENEGGDASVPQPDNAADIVDPQQPPAETPAPEEEVQNPDPVINEPATDPVPEPEPEPQPQPADNVSPADPGGTEGGNPGISPVNTPDNNETVTP